MRRFLSTAAASTLVLALSAPLGLAQDSSKLDLQVNDNGQASYESFNRAFEQQGSFAKWDTNHDNVLSREEFAAGAFGQYDRNADNVLDQHEIASMQSDTLPGQTSPYAIEPDSKGQVSADAFDQAFKDADTFNAWDTDKDGALSPDEFSHGVFSQYDTNADDMWDEDEMAQAPQTWDAPVKAGAHGANADASAMEKKDE